MAYADPFIASILPAQGNPIPGQWADQVGLSGLNPAAQAAAKTRLTNQGFLGLSRIAPMYWQQLLRRALQLSGQAAQIPTTSSGLAFLQGFGGTGGFSSLANVLGGLNIPGVSNIGPTGQTYATELATGSRPI